VGDHSRKALARISKIRRCTFEQAKQFCARIQGLQEGKKSSWFDISQSLLQLDQQGRSYSDRDVAAKAKSITTGFEPSHPYEDSEDSDSEFGIVVEEPEIQKFEGAGQHEPFLDWITRHSSRGYVLNVREKAGYLTPILHTADCSHLKPYPDDDIVATSHVKLCSTDRSKVKKEGQRLAVKKIEYCQHCDI